MAPNAGADLVNSAGMLPVGHVQALSGVSCHGAFVQPTLNDSTCNIIAVSAEAHHYS
jgi:hypothetical protein